MIITSKMIARDIVFNAFEAKVCGNSKGIPRSFIAKEFVRLRREGINNVLLFDAFYMYLLDEVEEKVK